MVVQKNQYFQKKFLNKQTTNITSVLSRINQSRQQSQSSDEWIAEQRQNWGVFWELGLAEKKKDPTDPTGTLKVPGYLKMQSGQGWPNLKFQ